jgi:hypothetical protein
VAIAFRDWALPKSGESKKTITAIIFSMCTFGMWYSKFKSLGVRLERYGQVVRQAHHRWVVMPSNGVGQDTTAKTVL